MTNPIPSLQSRLLALRRTHYRVAGHGEAGLFDSMTGATIWALKHLPGRKWRIEPVSSGSGTH